jgi:predicted DNA-binding protein with PD1-like motif
LSGAFFSSISRYCETHDIHWATLHGIGAVEDIEIGYYDLEEREYVFRREMGPFEVASMDGNITEIDGEEPVVHAHAVLSRCDQNLECIGGHLRRAVVAVTLEIVMWEVTQPLIRRYDEETGLNLITVAG